MLLDVKYSDYKDYWKYHPSTFAFKDTYDKEAGTIRIRTKDKKKTEYYMVEYGFLIDRLFFNYVSDSYNDVVREYPEDVNEIAKRVVTIKIRKGGKLKESKAKYMLVNE